MSQTMQSIPPAERPRERLLKYGPDVLSVRELLAILLGSGSKDIPVMELATRLTQRFPTVRALLDASVQELMAQPGIGEAKAISLKAVLGLAKHYQMQEKPKTVEEVVCNIRHKFGRKESLLVMLVNIKGEIFYEEMVSVGTLSEILVHPREVFAPAIRHGAHQILLAHNHPSGDPTPSKNDLNITKELIRSGKLLGIEIKDHLIIGRETFTSMAAEGILSAHEKVSGGRSRLSHQPV